MIFRALSLSLIILVCFDLFADVPGADRYTEVSTEEFDEYFSFLYGRTEGGEILLSLSPSFIENFQSDSCLLSAVIEAFNTEGDITKWAQIAGMTLVNLNPEVAARQQFHVGGLGYNLQIRLMYSVNGCPSSKPEQYKTQNKIIFRFDDINELDERQQTLK